MQRHDFRLVTARQLFQGALCLLERLPIRRSLRLGFKRQSFPEFPLLACLLFRGGNPQRLARLSIDSRTRRIQLNLRKFAQLNWVRALSRWPNE